MDQARKGVRVTLAQGKANEGSESLMNDVQRGARLRNPRPPKPREEQAIPPRGGREWKREATIDQGHGPFLLFHVSVGVGFV